MKENKVEVTSDCLKYIQINKEVDDIVRSIYSLPQQWNYLLTVLTALHHDNRFGENFTDIPKYADTLKKVDAYFFQCCQNRWKGWQGNSIMSN